MTTDAEPPGPEHPDLDERSRFARTDTPTVIDGVELAVFEGAAVLFDEASSMLHRLGAIAGAVWVCCDGTSDVATIVADVAESFGLEPDEVAPVVHDTLRRFADEGLLVGHASGPRVTFDLASPAPLLADDGTEILRGPPDP